jgi:hypothetical protein
VHKTINKKSFLTRTRLKATGSAKRSSKPLIQMVQNKTLKKKSFQT